jgi:acyl dehydratase
MLMSSPLEYSFDEIEVGLKHNFEVIIDEELEEDFARISGDFNPLHMDEKYAKETEFGKRVCHGMLLASFFSRLVGMYLPGKNALYFSQNLNFVGPCFIGDKISVQGEVIDKSESTRIISLKTTIKNQEEKSLIEGTAKVLVR